MAEVNTRNSGHKKLGVGKSSRKSTRIDMTAMVDVAFLLLTFFVLTSMLETPKVMEVVTPDGQCCEEGHVKVLQEKILNVVLDENDSIQYFIGNYYEEAQFTDYSVSGIRQVLEDHIYKSDRYLCVDYKDHPACWDPVVVIKPRSNSRFANLVDVLDELEIVKAPKYVIDDFSPVDSLLLADASAPTF